ncbi:MAG: cytosine permease, partial [Thermoplasmata archaeon]
MDESANSLHGVEIIGVSPIPVNERVMSPGKVFIFWSMASASALTPLIAYLLNGMGLIYILVAFAISFCIGLLPAGIFSEMGRKTPVPALVISRKTYGYATSSAFSLVFTFVNLGWFGLNDVTGGLILASVTHTESWIWFFFMAAFQIILVIFGAKYLEKFYRYTSAVLIASYLILAYFLFSSYHISMSSAIFPTSSFSWGSAIGIILAFSILAWAYKISTITRFARSSYASEEKSEKIKFFVASPVGIMVP